MDGWETEIKEEWREKTCKEEEKKKVLLSNAQ